MRLCSCVYVLVCVRVCSHNISACMFVHAHVYVCFLVLVPVDPRAAPAFASFRTRSPDSYRTNTGHPAIMPDDAARLNSTVPTAMFLRRCVYVCVWRGRVLVCVSPVFACVRVPGQSMWVFALESESGPVSAAVGLCHILDGVWLCPLVVRKCCVGALRVCVCPSVTSYEPSYAGVGRA